MSAYAPKELDRLWRQEQITAEQAVGHLVQLVLELQQRQADLEKRLRQLEQRTTP